MSGGSQELEKAFQERLSVERSKIRVLEKKVTEFELMMEQRERQWQQERKREFDQTHEHFQEQMKVRSGRRKALFSLGFNSGICERGCIMEVTFRMCFTCRPRIRRWT